MIVRLIIAGLLISTIGLAGCGKKGPLEPPKISQSIIDAH
jgi:predicted small lipoprotein YifL